MAERGIVVVIIPDDQPLRGMWIESAYVTAGQYAAAQGGTLAGPPELVICPCDSHFLRWPMVRRG